MPVISNEVLSVGSYPENPLVESGDDRRYKSSPSGKLLAIFTSACIALAAAGCTPRNKEGFLVDQNGACAEENTARQQRCLTEQGGVAGQENDDTSAYRPYGAAIHAQAADGFHWGAFVWDRVNWDPMSGKTPQEGVRRVMLATMLPGGEEQASDKDRAAVACTLAAAVLDAKDDNVPTPETPLDFPHNIAQRIRAGAWSVEQLIAAGNDKYREGVRGKEDPNAGHFREARDFCNAGTEWLLFGLYRLDSPQRSPVVAACGEVCQGDSTVIPYPKALAAEPQTVGS